MTSKASIKEETNHFIKLGDIKRVYEGFSSSSIVQWSQLCVRFNGKFMRQYIEDV